MDVYRVKYESIDAVALRCFQNAYGVYGDVVNLMDSKHSCASLISNYGNDWKSVSNIFHPSTKNASRLLESNEYYSQMSKDFVSERNESPTLSTDEMETIDKKSVEETIPSIPSFSDSIALHSSDNELEDNEQVIQEPSPVVVQNPDKGDNDDAICESKEDNTLSELPKELPKEETISDSDGDDKPLFPPVPSLPVPLTKRAQRVHKRQQHSGERHESHESHEIHETHELHVEPSLEESQDNHDMSVHSSLQEPKESSHVDDSEFDWDDDSIWNVSSSDQSPVLPPPLPNQPKPQLVKEDVSELPQELGRKKWNVKHEREWSDDWNERPAQELAKKERLKERKEESIEEEWSDDWDEPPKQSIVKKEPIQMKKEEWSDDWDEPPKQEVKKESIEEEWSDWDEPPSQQETSQSSYRIPNPRKPIQPSLQKDDWSDEDLPEDRSHIQIESKDWPEEPVQPRNPPHSPELIKSGLSSQFFNKMDSLHDTWSDEDLPVERISEKEEWSDWEDLPTERSNPVVIQKPSRSAKRGSQGGVFDDLFESPKKDTKQRITEFLCTIPDLSFLADPLINIHYG